MSLLDSLMSLENDSRATDRNTIIKSPIPYPGGKSRSMKYILEHIPYREKYCEPFGGSATILLARVPSKQEIYNDRFGGVVDFFRCMRDDRYFEKFMKYLKVQIYSREDFITYKRDWVDEKDIAKRAVMWYITILHSFSSLGKFFGRATDKYVHMDKISGKLLCLQKVHARLKGVLIENLDWTRCIEDFDSPETVFYVDPPYIDTPKIYDHTLSKSDHQRLLDMLFDCQGFVAVSGYPNEVYDSMPWDDRIEYEVFVSTQTGAFNKENRQAKYKNVKKRQNVKEVLWIKE